MPALETLPAELVLRIVAYLPLQALRNLRLVSRSWHDFFCEHESTIYHHAALLHNFIHSIHTLLPEAKAAHPLKFLQDVPDWREYCRMYFQLQRNWFGGGEARAKFYGGHPYDVHRLKVDEEHGILITTHEFGGLTVFDLDTTEILWRLDSTYVRRYAHCEYENGFLVFDRLGAFKEVWRLSTLFDESEMPRFFRPNTAQLDACATAESAFKGSSPRGHFRPWALIETAEFGRAFRFVYPTLLVSGLRRAYLWNVVTATLELEVDNVQGNAGGGDINYVELSHAHVFVCSTSALRIFSRAEGGRMIYEIPSYQLVYSDIRMAIQLDPALARQKLASHSEGVTLPAEPTMSTALYTASYAEFSAVHVSRDGNDLAAQLSDSRQIVIRDFMRVVRGEISLRAAALENGKTIPRLGGTDEHFSIYLAFEFARLGIVTTSGIYIATVDPMHHGLVDEDLIVTGRKRMHGIPQSAIDAGLSFPYLTFVSLPFYHDRRQLAKVTCLQMTESKLFFVWDAMYKPEHIDFFRRLGMIPGNTSPSHGPDDDGDGDHGGAGGGAGGGAALGGQGQGTQVVLASGSGVQIEDLLDQTPGAGSSTETIHGEVPIDVIELFEQGEGTEGEGGAGENAEAEDSDDNNSDGSGGSDTGDDSDDDDDDDDDDWNAPPHGGGHPLDDIGRDHNLVPTGPIVFCIDFSPKV
ncbi:hypothetical protein GSI_04020 [Ganoderma sinense ZZ0214-1]|uniref:F-box domain-containing protein n=1 Tax=Ganoderma sinense ZZ0214-1 TaxID=1077348 RepID=A0A2G8SI05_9APHY|nr:hypothetical protein GSI_04020 [Ganoderma sinense ZZ0214-1]